MSAVSRVIDGPRGCVLLVAVFWRDRRVSRQGRNGIISRAESREVRASKRRVKREPRHGIICASSLILLLVLFS